MNRQRRSQKNGQVGETIATLQLKLLGLEMVDHIYTGWLLVRWVDYAKHLAYVVPGAKVRGDRTAIVPGTGQRVLAEVKTFDDERLTWSRLEAHQHVSLRDNAAYGGLSLLVWVKDGEALVLDYPSLIATGWGPGHGIGYREAAYSAEWKGVNCELI